ncbi:MAG: DNA repair protein RecO [Cyanobacteriota bacterium]
MSNYKTDAIVLRTYDFKDYDRIIVLYSKDRGLIRAVAKGVKNPKSKLRGRLEPLMASGLILYEGRNLDSISQCDTIESFKHLRKDLKKITYAMYFAELASAFGVENDPQSEYFYNFIFNSLKELETSDENVILETLIVNYSYKLISWAGYKPVFDYCGQCRSKILTSTDICFNTDSGMAVCPDCSSKNANLTCLPQNLYQYLLNLAGISSFPFNLDVNTVTKAHSLLFEYIDKKSNYKLKTPKLIETLCLS